MAVCKTFIETQVDASGVSFDIFQTVPVESGTCGDNTDFFILSPSDYYKLKADADAIVSIDSSLAFIDPLEISAAFGVGFALIFAISAVAFKVAVGKRMVKMI